MFVWLAGGWNVWLDLVIGCGGVPRVLRPCLDFRRIGCRFVGIGRSW